MTGEEMEPTIDLTLDDLIGKCETCGGTGENPFVQKRAGSHSYGRQVWSGATDLDPVDCSKCLGTGRRGLTTTGRAVVELFTIFRKFEEKNRLGALTRVGDEKQ